MNRWDPDIAGMRAQSQAHARQALRLAPSDQFVLAAIAGAEMNIGGDYALASHLAERAIELNPRNAYSLFWGGWIDIEFNRLERALDRLQTVLRLEPVSRHRDIALFGLAQAQFFLGREAEAVETVAPALRVLDNYPPAHAIHAAALARLGRLPAAEAAIAPLRARGLERDCLRYFSREDHRETVREALARIPAARSEASA
jgi:tetratricopeptide (TPR) repeat protein